MHPFLNRNRGVLVTARSIPARLGRRAAQLAAAAVAASALAASAHETWIVPAEWQVSGNDAARLMATSGMDFPTLDYAIERDRVARADARCADGRSASLEPLAARGALGFSLRCAAPGLASVALALAPRTLTLADDEVAGYFEEIAASAAVRAAWAAREGREPFVETYTKHARTGVEFGRGGTADGFVQPLGLALELVPMTAAREIRVGARFETRLLLNGAPLAEHAVLLRTATGKPRVVATDADGRAAWTLGAAGAVLVYSTYLRRNADDSAWVSDFTTLTFEVR